MRSSRPGRPSPFRRAAALGVDSNPVGLDAGGAAALDDLAITVRSK